MTNQPDATSTGASIPTDTDTLQKEVRRLNELLTFSVDWVWEMDPSNRLTFVSPSTRALLGYEPSELVGKTLADISPPGEAARRGTILAPSMAIQRPFQRVETMLMCRDSRIITVEISGIPLFDQYGIWNGYRGVAHDVTQRRQIETALQQRETSLKEAQRIAHLGNWEWDVYTGTLIWSDEVYRVFGHEPHAFTPTFDAFVQTIHPDDVQAVQAAIQQTLKNNVPYVIQYRILQPDGTERIIYAEGEQRRGPQGDVAGMFGILQDVTERVHAEAAIRQLNAELEQRIETRTRELHQSQQMLQTVLDALPIAIFWKDREFVFQGYNEAFLSLTGLPGKDALIGKTDEALPWKPEETAFFRLVDQRVMETDTAELDFEEPIRNAQGEERWLRTSKIPMHDVDGTVVGVIGMLEDKTEQKQAEADLHTFMAMAESSPDAIGIANPDGTITYANLAFRDLFGYGEDTIGMLNVSLFTEEDQRERMPSLMAVVASRGGASRMLTGQRKDGSTFPALVTPSVIRDSDGNIRAIPAIIRDMSDQQRQEAERAALQQQIIDAQQAAIRELSTPLIPLARNVVLMPLIGTIDTQRAQQVMETLLEGIAAHQADTVILDITGVSMVDTQVANALIQAAQAVRLLGAQIVLTGIGPTMAQTLVQLGADLNSIQTRGSLQRAIAEVLMTQ